MGIRQRLLPSPLWLLIALAAVLGLNGSSASAGSTAETRVRVNKTVTDDSVGPISCERPAGVVCLRPATGHVVVGSCLATNTGPLAIWPAGNPGAFTSAINATTKGTNHTLARHFPGGANTAGKSIFNSGESIPSLVTAAQRVAPATQANTNLVRIVDAGRTIGIDVATGQPTSIYTVVTTSGGNLVTMHPGVP